MVAELAADLATAQRTADLLDRDAVWVGKRQALSKIFEVPRSPARKVAFAAFVDRGG